MQEKKYPVKKNAELELPIEKTAFGGKGIGRFNDYIIFVKDTLPGDTVRVRVFKRKENFAEARLLEIIKPSEKRIPAPCEYFNWCGGCTWQNLSYSDQLEIKKEHVTDSLRHLGNMQGDLVKNTIPSQNIWGYRNKMEFSFSDRRWLLPHELGNAQVARSYALGLHIPGTYDKILDIDKCLIQSDQANQALQIIDDYCRQKGLVPYGIKSHDGFLRYLVIRESNYTGELMINLVTAYNDLEILKPLAYKLKSDLAHISSIVNNINPRKAQIAVGVEEFLLYGKSFITEKLGPFEFQISANSFFQTNTPQAEKLYQVVLDYADLHGTERVWDLYAGTGTITLFLSLKAHDVLGLELSETAVQDAQVNARTYGRENVKFLSGDLLYNLDHIEYIPDVIVTDPPRSGMHPRVCQKLAHSGANKIIYVSCNPTTLARDVKILQDHYKLIEAQPVDMFPHTYHIETVATLEKI